MEVLKAQFAARRALTAGSMRLLLSARLRGVRPLRRWINQFGSELDNLVERFDCEERFTGSSENPLRPRLRPGSRLTSNRLDSQPRFRQVRRFFCPRGSVTTVVASTCAPQTDLRPPSPDDRLANSIVLHLPPRRSQWQI